MNVDDEAANDFHEVDFIAKALANRDKGPPSAASLLEMPSESAPAQFQHLRESYSAQMYLHTGSICSRSENHVDVKLYSLQGQVIPVEGLLLVSSIGINLPLTWQPSSGQD